MLSTGGESRNETAGAAAAAVEADTTAAAIASIDPNEIDQILSRELSKLDVQDRESISEEIHGVRCLAIPETPELLATSLSKLSEELDQISSKTAFDKSQVIATRTTTYVNTPDFRLRFLRAELFDAKKAAVRMVNFLELVMEIFEGREELLQRPLKLSDLKKHELAILHAGNFQLLPFRDRSGRRIFTAVMNLGIAVDFRLSGKILLYMFYVASEGVESQRKGVVNIFFPSTSAVHSVFKSLPGPEDRKLAERLNNAFPIRLVATHFCIPDTILFRVFRAMILVSLQGDHEKFRTKTHIGQWTEWQYELMGYGIPVDLLPMSPTGNIKTNMFKQFIRLRKAIEAPSGQNTETSSGSDDSIIVPHSAIECPNLNDVVFRAGKSYMCHPGNVMFRSLIESRMEEHYSATKREKASIAWSIVGEIERRGGRFLKWDIRGWWTLMEDRAEIRYKIPTCFRDFSRAMKARRRRT